jgi:hypothetical protein
MIEFFSPMVRLLKALVGAWRAPDDPRTLLATDVVVVDVRSGELVAVGSRATLERYRLAAPQPAVHPEGFVTVGSIDRSHRLDRYSSVAVVLDVGSLWRGRARYGHREGGQARLGGLR